ncbi:MAG: hypothetical protein V4437_01895 [Patescibacteria group bacterium]
MDSYLIRELKRAEHAAPNSELASRIIARIERAKLEHERMRAIFFGTATLTSAIAFIPALMFGAFELSHSAFYEYASLLFTDSGTLVTLWREIGLALIESAPLFGAITILSVLFVFLTSARGLTKHINNLFSIQRRLAA